MQLIGIVGLCYTHLAFMTHRGVAQLGSALLWGSRGRGFKSRRSDLIETRSLSGFCHIYQAF